MNLFQKNYKNVEPLAYKLRPKSLDDFVGQENFRKRWGNHKTYFKFYSIQFHFLWTSWLWKK